MATNGISPTICKQQNMHDLHITYKKGQGKNGRMKICKLKAIHDFPFEDHSNVSLISYVSEIFTLKNTNIFKITGSVKIE